MRIRVRGGAPSWQGGYRPPAPPLRAFGQGNKDMIIVIYYIIIVLY